MTGKGRTGTFDARHLDARHFSGLDQSSRHPPGPSHQVRGDQESATGESLGAGTGFIPVGAERLGIRGFLFPNRSPSAGDRVRGAGWRRGGGGVENQHV